MEQVGQPAHEVGRMALRSRIAAATEDLHDACVMHPIDRVHGVDHGQQRGAPRADADDVARTNRGFKMEGRPRPQFADGSVIVVTRDVDDLDLGQAEADLEGLLELRPGAARCTHGDAHDALVLGPFEQSRDLGLAEPKPRRDLGLFDAHLVIESGDAGHQAKLVGSSHVSSR